MNRVSRRKDSSDPPGIGCIIFIFFVPRVLFFFPGNYFNTELLCRNKYSFYFLIDYFPSMHVSLTSTSPSSPWEDNCNSEKVRKVVRGLVWSSKVISLFILVIYRLPTSIHGYIIIYILFILTKAFQDPVSIWDFLLVTMKNSYSTEKVGSTFYYKYEFPIVSFI